jgi:hypothetical protein
VRLKDIGEQCDSNEECKEDLKCNKVSQRFLEYPKACCPENLHWNGTLCVYLEGERCTEIAPCDKDLRCRGPAKSNISGTYCCPAGKKWNGSSCITVDKYFIVYVPISYSQSEFEQFKSESEKSFRVWSKEKSPFKECSDPQERVEPYFIEPKDCPETQSGCSHICGDCNSLAVKCARKANLPKEIVLGTNAIISGMCKGNSCPGACGCAAGIPSISSVSNMGPCRGGAFQGYEVAFHEMGHSWGLGHVSCGVACHACMLNNPNCPDCSEPESEKKLFIMDYCAPMAKYGPAAYNHLKNNVFKKYMEGCK